MAFIGLLTAASASFAQDKASTPMDHSRMRGVDGSTMNNPAQLDIAPAAADAVATVERFNKALSAGQLDKAGVELDANVLILEDGGAERTASEYLGEHAKSDAAFLQGAKVQLVRRTARAEGNIAWVGSESEVQSTKYGRIVTTLSLETMVLTRTDVTWKIAHIHWSSRTKRPGDAR
jgi:ketosteroid isomerase-like protein